MANEAWQVNFPPQENPDVYTDEQWVNVFQAYQERPYHVDSTTSHLLSEVKQHRAWSVIQWGAMLEFQVFFFLPVWLFQLSTLPSVMQTKLNKPEGHRISNVLLPKK
jgi:hypothetical protein